MHRVLAAAIALVVALACAATARPAATFVLKGKGWGHGLGLGQYGTQGYARDGGRDYRWILDHYYTGTTLGAAGVGRVRVLVASGASRVTVGSAASFSVTDANGRTYNLNAGTHTIRANLQVRSANGQLRTLAGPVRFDPGAAVLRLSGNAYRGFLRVRAQGGLVSAVNDIGLEPYVKGVIAWEMPASWHPEALKAQAVVARTYGLVSRKTGQWFDLYDDTRSQVYGGVRAEDARTNAAVDATQGEVARSRGRSTTRPPAGRPRLARTSGARPGSRISSASRTSSTASRPITSGARPTPRTTARTAAATASGRRSPSSAPSVPAPLPPSPTSPSAGGTARAGSPRRGSSGPPARPRSPARRFAPSSVSARRGSRSASSA